MANVDDFFAKKDKKKKRGFNKANTDVLAKNLEEQDQRVLKAESDKTFRGSLATSEATKLAFQTSDIQPGSARQSSQNDEEWKDYQKEKDYSGLKIENLRIEEKESTEDDDHEVNEDGEKVPKGKGHVWRKGQKNNHNHAADDDTSEDEAPTQAPGQSSASEGGENPAGATMAAAVKSTAGASGYVPPHLRGSTMASGPALQATRLSATRGYGGRPRAAPDIKSEVYFPSLGGAAPAEGVKHGSGRDDFYEVRSGGSSALSTKSVANPKLALDNKFDALRD
eukprot:maker-scaffold222_size251774-snap-gene-1.19 protein:Tk11440 transcript:maker-scaffold222_size251774-snap-gene-1.19-mRNA-1 annotation:"cdv3 homolog a"